MVNQHYNSTQANGGVQKQIDELINTVRQGFSSKGIPEDVVLIDVSQYTYPVIYMLYLHVWYGYSG